MITLADIQARFPGAFDSVSSELGELVIAEAALYVLEDTWGDYYDQGILYLSAHFLAASVMATASGGAVTGAITSQRIGAVSVSFSSAATGASMSAGSLNSTAFGQRFRELRALVQGGPVAVVLA